MKIHGETENEEVQAFEVATPGGASAISVKFPDGRLQVCPLQDVEKKEWYHIYPEEGCSSDHFLESSLELGHMCADCHRPTCTKNSTFLRSLLLSILRSVVESCHGPGGTHGCVVLA